MVLNNRTIEMTDTSNTEYNTKEAPYSELAIFLSMLVLVTLAIPFLAYKNVQK